ncbi:hypothetical protein PG993_005460 [Apiospora rasikravindrae]|uniref:Heterokaryon incompatibility domain-containing protein n=1 Tax=Apiospora rasikravindrae TaxID=990691 RepID=A0ABR1TFM5_9PEZI
MNRRPLDSAAPDVDALEAWYADYTTFDDRMEDTHALEQAMDDWLDEDGDENKISNLASHVVVTENLCASCRAGLASWPRDVDQSPMDLWQVNILDLTAASRAGCKLCSFFLNRLDPPDVKLFRKIEERLLRLGKKSTSRLGLLEGRELWLGHPGRKFDEGAELFSRCHRLGQTCVAAQSDLLDTVSTWLERCNVIHNECQRLHHAERPSRLVSVGGNSVRVVETHSFETLPRYATLSYCWGHADFTMLTLESLAAFQKDICLSDLPKTLKDAIFITRKLGLDYIWIDALCIIQRQEDHSDWLCESSRMRSIYGGSHVNIAASSATDVTQGCFGEPTGYIGGVKVPITTREGSYWRIFSDSELLHTASSSNLLKRAWAFQERLLSPRTIHFGEHGALWECRSDTLSSHLPDGFDDLFYRSKLVCPEDEEWEWNEIVQSYTPAQLTVGSDRLPALAGVARRHSELTKDQYIAGMWRRTLVDQLTWMSAYFYRGDLNRHTRPSWRAPTWSWVSVDGPVEPDYFVLDRPSEENLFISVRDVWAKPSARVDRP